MKVHCANYVTGVDEETNDILKTYDSWKLIYVSEYTIPSKTNSAAVMCFEKSTNVILSCCNKNISNTIAVI